jgi:hypothetical protein
MWLQKCCHRRIMKVPFFIQHSGNAVKVPAPCICIVASFCHIVLVQQIFNGPMERFLLSGFQPISFWVLYQTISYNKNGMVEHKTKYNQIYIYSQNLCLAVALKSGKKNSLKRRRCTGCAGTYITCVHVSCHRSFFHRLTVTDGNGVACAAQRCPGSGTKRYGQIMPRVALRLLGRPINMDLELRVIGKIPKKRNLNYQMVFHRYSIHIPLIFIVSPAMS